jgi:hypothetical protein
LLRIVSLQTKSSEWRVNGQIFFMTAGIPENEKSPSVETERPLTIACHMKKVEWAIDPASVDSLR